MNDFFFSSSYSSKEEEEEENIKVMAKKKALLEEMNFDYHHHPELSLALSSLSNFIDNTYTSSSTESDHEASSCRKRKMLHTSIELHLNHPLPFHWEQCLDLQSGRVYYMNRETLKRSWSRPKERKVDLELNISRNSSMEEMNKKKEESIMMAVPCFNCHLLVMLCKSSPTCPNCKYVYPPHALDQAPPPPKSLETLSLLN